MLRHGLTFQREKQLINMWIKGRKINQKADFYIGRGEKEVFWPQLVVPLQRRVS